jgi:hypothetical protein
MLRLHDLSLFGNAGAEWLNEQTYESEACHRPQQNKELTLELIFDD